jgi:hypothetical protein
MHQRIVALAVVIAAIMGGALFDGLLRAHAARAAALPVSVYVESNQSSQAGNSCTQTIVLASGDTSGLTNFTWTFTNPSSTCRYAPGATASISLP